MKIKKNDVVKVISGKYKGRLGKVIEALPKDRKIKIQDIGLIKKHIKPQTNRKHPEGGIIEIQKYIDISNVMFYSEKLKRPVRVGYYTDSTGKKNRIARGKNILFDETKSINILD